MKRSIVIPAFCDLGLYVLAVLAIAFSPALRLAGIAGRRGRAVPRQRLGRVTAVDSLKMPSSASSRTPQR